MIDLKIILITVILIELLAVIMRFVFKIKGREVYIRIMKKFKFKKFYHLHHLIWGVLLIILFYEDSLLLSLGIGIVLSDLIHHFVVLWLITGSPEFHIVYKNIKEFQEEEKLEQRKIKRFFKHLVHEITD